MNGHHDTPHRNAPRRLPAGRVIAIAAIAALATGMHAAHAQQNAGNVGRAVIPARQQACSSPANAVCGLEGASGSQIAPDKYVAVGTTALAGSQQQVDAVKERLEDVRGEGGGQASASSGVTTRGGTIEPTGLGLFLRAEGQRDTSDSTDFDPGYARRTTSFTIGADYRVHPLAVLGLAVGSRSSRSTLDKEVFAGGNSQERGTSFSIYGSYLPVDNAYVDAIVQFGRSRYDLRRDLPTLSDTAQGRTSSKEQTLSVGGGYGFPEGRLNWGPHARLSYTKVNIDGFTEERNATNTQLTVAGRSFTSLVSGLGAQLSYAWSQPWGVLVPSVDLEWKHQFRQDKTRNLVATLSAVGSGAEVMDIRTTPVDKNYFSLDLGLAAHLGQGRSALVNYSTVLGRSGQSSNVVTAELRLEF